MTINRKTSLIIVSGIMITLFFIWILKSEDRTTINFLSVTGTFASLVGLGVTYVQVKEIKTISESNKEAIIQTKDSINNVLLLSDSVHVSHIINETQGYLIKEETINLALLRMKDLKRYLIHFKEFDNYTGKSKKSILNQMIIDLTNDTSNIFDKLNPQTNMIEINLSKINNNLEKILDFVLEIEQGTKNKKLK